MARQKSKTVPNGNYLELYENEYKPEILNYYQVPIETTARVLGVSVTKVQEQLRSGAYDYGIARPCPGGKFSYEVYPLRLCSFIEGRPINAKRGGLTDEWKM